MHTNMNGAESPEMRVGPDGGFRDTFVAPASFLHLHLGTPWVQDARVGPHVSTCQGSVSILDVRPWLWQNRPGAQCLTARLHREPSLSSAWSLPTALDA